MRAWLLTKQAPVEQEPMELVELPVPEPLADEVRIAVTACGICRTDLHILEGDLPMRAKPVILGHEIVGVVDAVGSRVSGWQLGERVGATWLGRTCGACWHCRRGRENYCHEFRATGWDFDGGFAEYAVVHEDAAFRLRNLEMADVEIAPLMCPGVAGYCAFRLCEVESSARVGLYGFGPTAFYVLKTARHLGHEVYVSSRSPSNQERAHRHGAAWSGDASREQIPVLLDGAVVFPPAGPLVELAASQVVPGGIVVLAPVSMSPIEIRDYSANLWGRDLKTLYNINRRDSSDFLHLATRVDLTMGVEQVPFEECQQALARLKQGKLEQPNVVVRVQAEKAG